MGNPQSDYVIYEQPLTKIRNLNLTLPYQYIVLVQQVEEGHQVNPLGEVLSCSLLDGEVGQQLEESVLPLLLRLLP